MYRRDRGRHRLERQACDPRSDWTPLNVTRFLIAPPEPLPIATEGVLAVSPDGRQIAYVAGQEGGRRLYVRNIEQFEGRPISGSEGADTPRFSPDGKWLAFVADRKLKKVAVDGGDAVIVTDFTEGRGLTWESNEAILFNRAVHPAYGECRRRAASRRR